MKLRWKIFIGFLAAFGAPLLLIFGLHFKLRHDVASYKKQLLARGEKLAVADWMPKSPPNDTLGREFIEIIKPISEIKRDRHPSLMRMVAPGKAQVSWRGNELYDWEFKKRTNIWDIIESDFDENAETSKALRILCAKGKIIFPVAYQEGYHALLPHLVSVKSIATWLSVATVLELRRGNKTEAAENLIALLQFLKNYETEPLLISHLVRIACLNIAFNATWEALQYEG